MKSSEILELVRAGYTRAEIDAMDGVTAAPTDEAPASETETAEDAPAAVDDVPVWAAALNSTLKEVKAALQASNRGADEMQDDITVIDSCDMALEQYITGKQPESKRKRGK